MFRVRWVAALAALMVAAAGCSDRPGKDAVTAVQGFLAAVQSGDRPAFEAAIDRQALRRGLRGQVMAVGRASSLDVDGGPSEFALDRMINPDNIHLVLDAGGAPLSGPPAADQVRPRMKRLDRRRVCLHDGTVQETCVLTFEDQKAGTDENGAPRPAGWRLVAMPGAELTVALDAPK